MANCHSPKLPFSSAGRGFSWRAAPYRFRLPRTVRLPTLAIGGIFSIRSPRGALLTHFELLLEKPHTSFHVKIEAVGRLHICHISAESAPDRSSGGEDLCQWRSGGYGYSSPCSGCGGWKAAEISSFSEGRGVGSMSDLPRPRLAAGDSKGGGGEKMRVRGGGVGRRQRRKLPVPPRCRPR